MAQAKTSTTLNTIAANLAASSSTIGASILSSVLNVASAGLLTLAEDQITILDNAIELFLSKYKETGDWETSFTAALNEFYSEETAEGNAIAINVLNFIARTIGTVKSLI